MKKSIANKLTRYLLNTMGIGMFFLLLIALAYSFATYKKVRDVNVKKLQYFVESILPDTTRDISVGNIEALRVRMEFVVLKESVKDLQVKLVGTSNNIFYESDEFEWDCGGRKNLALIKNVKLCYQTQLNYSDGPLGVVYATQSMESFYSFFMDSNIPWLFFMLCIFLVTLLLIFRFLLKNEVVVPLSQLIQSLEKNDDLENENMFQKNAVEWDILSKAISEYKDKIVKHVKKRSEISKDLEKEKLMTEVTAQLAHDIRSPLAALDMMASNLPELDHVKRNLIRNATARIHNIANNLLDRNFNRNSNVSTQMFSNIIRSMLSEKREQYKIYTKISIHEYVDHKSYGAFAKIEINDFKRILSNLIDNAVQAIPNAGFVRVALSQNDENVLIEVFDNGMGIKAENLKKVTGKGFSRRREGNGLGLYFVDQKIKEWGGKFEIDSTPNVGTTARIILKKESAPSWFVSEIVVKEENEFVVLDDDLSIHEMWKHKLLQAMRRDVKIHHFENEKSFGEWFKDRKENNDQLICFFDYELIGNMNTGLDIIEKYKIMKNAILITSHLESIEIQGRCEKLGVRMIPKELAGFVPIVASVE